MKLSEMDNKYYLGDGVFVEFDESGMILTTSDGIEITNKIYIKPFVFDFLLQRIETYNNRKAGK